jgi:VanZ family protein
MPTPDSSQPDSSASPVKRVFTWAATLAWAAVIFRFSAIPGSNIPGRFAEIGHLGEYAVFGALLYAALRVDLDRAQAFSAAIVIASVYGMTDEFHQHFVVMRTPDVLDWATDTIGAALGAGFAAIAERIAGRLGRSRRAGD